jgi:parallel beta-helix repeat protein
MRDNTIVGSQLYGVYIFSGADGNTISGNNVSGSGKHGIYFKTGKNTITGNTLTGNGTVVDGVPTGSGIASYQDSDLAAAMADLQLPGSTVSVAAADPELLGPQPQTSAMEDNVIAENTISNNVDEGIELKIASGTRVESNVVTGNGSNGIYLASGASNTTVMFNTVSGNRGYGIKANGLDVVDNQWSKNTVFDNWAGGITITSGANNGVPAPDIVQAGRTITVTTQPGTIVEIFSDNAGQGRFFEARMTVASGTVTLTRTWKGKVVNATATDSSGNTSGFTFNRRSTANYLPFLTR